MSEGVDDALLAEQQAYYRARAREYDEWWERRGRYDRGPAMAAAWRAEAAEVEAALEALEALDGDVLELAAGTGIWTRRLARRAASLTVVDGAPEMLAVNAERVAPIVEQRGIPYDPVRADLFAWAPEQAYDLVFMGFWLSHVPVERWDGFWAAVRRALRPGGRVFFVDSRRDPETQAADHRLPDADGVVAVRKLNDGSSHRVIKRFHEPDALAADLRRFGFEAPDVRATARFFVFGSAIAPS